MSPPKPSRLLELLASLVLGSIAAAPAAAFIHPGLLQTRQDLEFMRQKVAAAEEPWKTAWDNLCREPFSAMNFQPKPVAHVVRGSYGRPSLGDRELTASANAAYSQALQWMDTALCIGVFCDDRVVFDRAVDHFLRGPGNAGITRYVYPSGQCEESARDQSHTQLGLGELAQACLVAWNQKVDLFGAAGNRLALGIEFTASYLLGDEPRAYGVISPQGRDHFSDVYEGVWQHYHFVKGLVLPNTARAIVKTRAGKSWSSLTLYRGLSPTPASSAGALRASPFAFGAGAGPAPAIAAPANAVKVASGEPLQAALDTLTNGGWVLLGEGLFVLPAPLCVPSGITLAGQGADTVLILEPKFTLGHAGATIVNADENLHDVTLRDFVIEGGETLRAPTTEAPDYSYVSGTGNEAVTLRPLTKDPNQDRRQRASSLCPSRAGIVFNAQRQSQMRDLTLDHLTVRRCTHDGVAIRGAARVLIAACDFSDNGSSVVPGPGLQHNLLLSHASDCQVSDSRLDDSLWGSGLELAFDNDVTLANNEAARNARNGIHLTESCRVLVAGNLAEGNDLAGILADTRIDGCRDVAFINNLARNNGGPGISMEPTVGAAAKRNAVLDNGPSRQRLAENPRSIKH